MKLIVLTLLLLFSLGCFLLAYFQNESKQGGYAFLSGFIILMLSGLLVASFGLEYQDGSITTTVAGTATTINTYTSIDNTERTIVSLPMIIGGLWGLYISLNALTATRREERYG